LLVPLKVAFAVATEIPRSLSLPIVHAFLVPAPVPAMQHSAVLDQSSLASNILQVVVGFLRPLSREVLAGSTDRHVKDLPGPGPAPARPKCSSYFWKIVVP
jgi:hypothetical protein